MNITFPPCPGSPGAFRFSNRALRGVALFCLLALAGGLTLSSAAPITGWAVGDAGTVFHTDGTTWTEQTTGFPSSIINTNLRGGVEFTDADHGWIAGFFGRLYHTTDGGTNWVQQNTGTTAELRGMDFVDDLNGWVVGGSGSGQILHTTNGGTTWSSQALPTGFTSNVETVKFVDTANGWATASGAVLHTTDGGATWSQQVSLGGQTTALEFVDTLHGWATSNGRFVYRTVDGGTTWTPVDVSNGLIGMLSLGLEFIDQNNGWLVGAGGAIRHTTDGGVTWVTQTNPANHTLQSVEFTDALNGWAVGQSVNGNSVGTIVHTTDGGATWVTQIDPEAVAHSLYSVEMIGEREGGGGNASVPDSGGVLLLPIGLLALAAAPRKWRPVTWMCAMGART